MPRLRFILLLLVLSCLAVKPAHGKQLQPDKKRVAEIQLALSAHGYAPGHNWKETQESCRSIAKARGWQTHRAPDARVLVFLGLGNKFSNSWVTELPGGHLDGKTDAVD